MLILACNTLKKFIKEKWDKVGSDCGKEIIRRFLMDNLTSRLKCLKEQLPEDIRKSLINANNQINDVIILIAEKEWQTTWKNLVEDLCNEAKGDLSYICINNMKILIGLSENINKYWKNHMTSFENINLTNIMQTKLGYIYNLCEHIIIFKSKNMIQDIKNNDKENLNNNDTNDRSKISINILKHIVKLLKEYTNWFAYDEIFNNNMISSLLYILKNCDPCTEELLDYFGELFKINLLEIEYKTEDTLRELIFDVFNELICIIDKVIIKGKNISETYEILIEESPNTLQGYESFILIFEKCLINFFKENFDYIKRENKNIELKNKNNGFFDKYTNSIKIGLNYLLQITAVKKKIPGSENDQIYYNAIEFWFDFVYRLITLKKQNNNNNNNYSQNIEELIAYLKNSVLYTKCFNDILDNLRELLCLNMTEPLELKIKLDERGDIAYDPDNNDSFNQNLHESTKNTLIYLSLIEPEKTKDLIVDQLSSETNVAQNTKKIDRKKVCCLCWSCGLISGSMKEKMEHDLLIVTFRYLFAMMDYCNLEGKEVCACNILFIASQYPNFICNVPNFSESIFKKIIFEFIKIDSEYIKNLSCETLLKLSNNECGKRLLLNQGSDHPFIVTLLKNVNDITNNLKFYMILMIYESFANIIDKETNLENKKSYLKELMKKPNEKFQSVKNKKNNNINNLNDVKVLEDIREIILINERISFALEKDYYIFYGSSIIKDIIDIHIYFNNQINISISNNNCNINNVKKTDYEFTNCSILKYFTSLVKNINDIQIISHDMIINFGYLIEHFNNNPIQNKEPNMLVLFTAIIDILKNQYPNICNIIWNSFSANIFKIIQNNYNSFPELFENFFKFIRSMVAVSLESIYRENGEIPQLLIDILFHGINNIVPCVYEDSLEAIQNLLNYILNPNINKTSQQNFFNNHLYKIFGQVFLTMIDGYHQNGIELQIKIIQLIIKIIDDEIYFNANAKSNFIKNIIDNLPYICPKMNKNQIVSFCYAIFNYSGNDHNFNIIIRNFITSHKIYRNEDEPI